MKANIRMWMNDDHAFHHIVHLCISSWQTHMKAAVRGQSLKYSSVLFNQLKFFFLIVVTHQWSEHHFSNMEAVQAE
jgi:hypothetical protein